MTEPTLDALQQAGADRHDPVRFRYLQALAARLPAQPPAVQAVLARRLQQAVADYAGQAHAGGAAPARLHAAQAPSPLAQLNRELAAHAQADALQAQTTGGASVSELKSVRQFAEVWSRIAAQQEVAQALDQGPENAGPLNPHKLMLRSLDLMRTLSPDYLRRFLAQAQALLWLEEAQGKAPRAPLRAGRARRAKP